jgi:uncharacterized protein YbjT (DUF2867 family)
MIAAGDIGQCGAESLLEPARGRRILALSGSEDYSPEDIAHAFSIALGKPVRVVAHPLSEVEPALTAAGFSADAARLFLEMFEAINAGLVSDDPNGMEFWRGKLTALDVVRQLLEVS